MNNAPAVRKVLRTARVDVATKDAGYGAIVTGSTRSPAVTVEFRTVGNSSTARRAHAALTLAGYDVQVFGHGSRFIRDIDAEPETTVVRALYVTPAAS